MVDSDSDKTDKSKDADNETIESVRPSGEAKVVIRTSVATKPIGSVQPVPIDSVRDGPSSGMSVNSNANRFLQMAALSVMSKLFAAVHNHQMNDAAKNDLDDDDSLPSTSSSVDESEDSGNSLDSSSIPVPIIIAQRTRPQMPDYDDYARSGSSRRHVMYGRPVAAASRFVPFESASEPSHLPLSPLAALLGSAINSANGVQPNSMYGYNNNQVEQPRRVVMLLTSAPSTSSASIPSNSIEELIRSQIEPKEREYSQVAYQQQPSGPYFYHPQTPAPAASQQRVQVVEVPVPVYVPVPVAAHPNTAPQYNPMSRYYARSMPQVVAPMAVHEPVPSAAHLVAMHREMDHSDQSSSQSQASPSGHMALMYYAHQGEQNDQMPSAIPVRIASMSSPVNAEKSMSMSEAEQEVSESNSDDSSQSGGVLRIFIRPRFASSSSASPTLESLLSNRIDLHRRIDGESESELSPQQQRAASSIQSAYVHGYPQHVFAASTSSQDNADNIESESYPTNDVNRKRDWRSYRSSLFDSSNAAQQVPSVVASPIAHLLVALRAQSSPSSQQQQQQQQSSLAPSPVNSDHGSVPMEQAATSRLYHYQQYPSASEQTASVNIQPVQRLFAYAPSVNANENGPINGGESTHASIYSMLASQPSTLQHLSAQNREQSDDNE